MSLQHLTLHDENAFVTGDPKGLSLTEDDVAGLRHRVNLAREDVLKQRYDGTLGFLELHKDTEVLSAVQAFANEHQGRFEDVVVAGIGGSALGAKAVYQALDDIHANLLPADQRKHPRLFVVDNVDPALVMSVGRLINPTKTLLIVITKSGGTLETMSGFLYFKKLIEDAVGPDWTKHVAFVTDPEKGLLRRMSEDTGIPSFPVPQNVGGRFSVLSAVGLLPLALVGVDVAGLLEGQRRVVESYEAASDPSEHIASRLAALFYLADTRAARNQIVCFPYADHLRESAFWFRQLWAESIGKATHRDGSPARVGTTPVFASGATDQHSQVQLYIEGPADKFLFFLTVDSHGEDAAVSGADGPLSDLAYLNGRSFGEFLRIEYEATWDALAEAGKPGISLHLDSLSAVSIGELFASLMLTTAIAGELYDINAFDQPGVEHAKVKINKALGK